MKKLIRSLVEVTGPSGYESEIRSLIKKEVKPFTDKVSVDRLGNLITRKGTRGKNGMRVMLAAHMDEIGLIITHVDEKGFARFATLGGVFPRNLAGGRVNFLDGSNGVIGIETPWKQYSSVPNINKMYIDFGVNSKKECPVGIGDVAAFHRSFQDLGDRLVSKAMDDRIGVAILIEVLKKVNSGPNEVVGVFTVQEEVGVRGATAAAYGVDPDLGIAIDVTGWGDTPNTKTTSLELGKGPAIKIKDSGMISDPKVVDWMETGAKRAKIPFQREILIGGSTDARAIQLTHSGVPVGAISIPCRYVHSPSEMVDINDVNNAIKLLVQLLNKPIKL